MEIRIRQTGSVVNEQEFRALYPNTSLPSPLSEQVLNDLDADVVFEGPQAQPTMYQIAFRDGVVQLAGKWYTKYSVADMSAEQIAAIDAQLKAANSSQASAELRDTDWCENASVRDTSVTPHLVNTAEFDAYRLALRVIAINPPVTVATWPTRPASTWSA